MSIAVELTDRHRNELRVEVPSTRRSSRAAQRRERRAPARLRDRRARRVPEAFAHYVEDDPECFRGPADGWRLAGVRWPSWPPSRSKPSAAARRRRSGRREPWPCSSRASAPSRSATSWARTRRSSGRRGAPEATRRAPLAGDERARRDRGSCCRWRRSRRSCAPVNWPGPAWARSAASVALAASPSAVDARDRSRAGAAGEAAALVFCGA